MEKKKNLEEPTCHRKEERDKVMGPYLHSAGGEAFGGVLGLLRTMWASRVAPLVRVSFAPAVGGISRVLLLLDGWPFLSLLHPKDQQVASQSLMCS